jgi:chaperonin GroEL
MSHTEVLFRDEARAKVLAGASRLADAVRVTLGPKSKSVLIGKKWGPPIVCNDGVTIVKEIHLEEPTENLGAQMLREAAVRTGDDVGDGTTTATILAQAMYAEGVRNVVAGSSAIGIKHGIDRAVGIAVDELHKLSRPVASKKEKEQVAAVSAHNIASVGSMVAAAVEKVGDEGAVQVEEAKGTETTLEVIEGLQFDHGFLSAYFVTDPQKMQVLLDNARVLLHDRKISKIADLIPLLEPVLKEGSPLLIIAEDVDSDALATLVVNKLRGALSAAAVRAPGFGDRRKEMLQDLAVLTGGMVVSEEAGMKLSETTLEQLGRASRVVIDKDTTTIIGGGGTKAAIEARCNEIRRQIEDTKSDYDREKLEERLAKLSGGVAVIRVGAHSEAELKSLKEAFDDAIHATKAAVAEGIVPGGGLALLRAIDAIEKVENTLQNDEKTGAHVVRLALEVPARQLAVNSGADPGVVVDRLRHGEGNYGFDAADGTYGDLIEHGIIDPTKVVRVALENAASVAGTLLLTDAALVEVPDEADQTKEPAAMME